MKSSCLLGCLLVLFPVAGAGAAEPVLPGTEQLTLERPLDVVMVEGIDRFALREIEKARETRSRHWDYDYASPERYAESVAENRQRFRELIGAVDERVDARGIELIGRPDRSSVIAESSQFTVHAARWPVFPGVTAEGLYLAPRGEALARVVALPDADWTPEMLAGIAPCPAPFAAEMAAAGCEVLVPTLINRDESFSGNPAIGRATNQPHREFIYRQAFELGRHVIGYEVQKVLAAVDQFQQRAEVARRLPVVVAGVGEGGLLALYSTALDSRIDGAIVSGYFDRREDVWQEPIYRNVWRLLDEFGDAEIASLIAPRMLLVECSPNIPEVDGPPPPRPGRSGAAPGRIRTPQRSSVMTEAERAAAHWQQLQQASGSVSSFILTPPSLDGHPPIAHPVIRQALTNLGIAVPEEPVAWELDEDRRTHFSAIDRQQRQVDQLVRYTQRLLSISQRQRDAFMAPADRSSIDDWQRSAAQLRERVHRELIGKLPSPTMAAHPRSRLVIDEPDHVGYEIVLDVFPDVIAGGILLLPKDLKGNDKRPVVVCQHGLEGRPMDTIEGPEGEKYRAYKGFSTELVRRGFIVYAPQNPYRGHDAFRTIQRKSNPLGRSLFSYIVPQHLAALRWLAEHPNVDADRIGFYGLSYGGKTAVRVPPLLVPTDDEPGYCLSICSADFNRWVAKNASVEVPFSYMFTGEYEIFEWNMGHVVDYGELAMLMAPRPFMVERGHRDGVGIDPWVAAEYAKVRQHYNQLGIGDRTEIEFFDGPHTINGVGTYDFLHRHLNWPQPADEK